MAVLLSAGGEVLHHAALARHADVFARLLRDQWRLLFGPRPYIEGRGLRRWRQELGPRGDAGAGAAQGADALPHAVELERAAGRAAKPRYGRRGQCAAPALSAHPPAPRTPLPAPPPPVPAQ